MNQHSDSLRPNATVDDIIRFDSHSTDRWGWWKQAPNGNSVCRRRIWRLDKATIIVFSELEENHGMSVTNAFERLADMTLNDDPTLDPGKIVWVEHEATGSRYDDTYEGLDLVRLSGLAKTTDGWRLDYDALEIEWRFLWRRDGDPDDPANDLPVALLALKRWLLGVNTELLTDLESIRAEEPRYGGPQ